MDRQVVYVLAADGEDALADELSLPLSAAGYAVVHNGTVAVGNSLIAEATKAVAANSPVVLCATPLAVGSAWTHQIVNASRVGGPPRVFVVLMDANAYVDQLSVQTKVARYCDNQKAAVRELLESLQKNFPVEPSILADKPVDGTTRNRPHFLDEPTGTTNFNMEAVQRFRAELRVEILADCPSSLSPWDFLARAGLWVEGSLSRTGLLLFGERPSSTALTSMVKCVQYFGTDRSAERSAVTFEGTVPEQITSAWQFVAERVIRGEAPSSDSAQSVNVYDLPMIAVREVLANSLVHRDYEVREACVHVRLFSDRLEVSSPGEWTGREIPSGRKYGLSELEGQSVKRNFRLAHILSWARFVEGEGSGIPSAVRDCRMFRGQEPVVEQIQKFVTVTINRTAPAARLHLQGEVAAADAVEADVLGEAGHRKDPALVPTVDTTSEKANVQLLGNELELEILEQSSDYSELRLRGAGGVRTRGLDRFAIDHLLEVVERTYAEDSIAQRVFGSAALRDLGEMLFNFLDGDERWFSQALADPRGVTVRIVAAQRLRHLPWELVVRDGSYLAVSESAPLLPVRAASSISTLGAVVAPRNRSLRVLFMAGAPEGVEPVLSYEAEEAGILEATADTGTELVVEESGTVEGLRFTADSYGPGYFDVLHVSGHATMDEGTPKFLMENELGGPAWVSADQIARAMDGQWPRLVFVSGSLTGGASDTGTIPSMSESLVQAGAPAVLGWALPVGDASATVFASRLYQDLAAGQPLSRAVVTARRQLYASHSRSWHLLRVYADRSPLTPVVTPRNTPGRERIRVRHAADEFLDPQTQISRVASRASFVGRRRVIQRCLRTLKQPLGSAGAAEALVLQGMGGLGKSTLASRLLERMPTHQRVVWFGRVSLTKFWELTSKITFQNLDQQIEATAMLARDEVDLAVRLRYLLDGPLGQIPCVFVFDDFEQGNLEERGGGHVLSSEMAQILPALLKAIREANSPSRVMITSRYQFPAPAGTVIRVEPLETLSDVEQAKKVANLANLRPGSLTVPAAVKDRAIEAAGGNPRLLDWLDKIVADATLDVDDLIAAIEDEADRFRESIFARRLIEAQPAGLQEMLARVNVVELPVPAATIYAVHDHPEATSHLRRAAQLGLLEEGTDPETGEPRYFVSNVLRPLIRPLLTDDEYRQACAAAARSLYRFWVTPEPAADAGWQR